jgi:hypothetical protein
VTAVIELGAGLALLCFPSTTVALLVGGTPLEAPAALTAARVGGAGLLALGVHAGLREVTRKAASREDWSPPCCFTTSPRSLSSLSLASALDCTAWGYGRLWFSTR